MAKKGKKRARYKAQLFDRGTWTEIDTVFVDFEDDDQAQDEDQGWLEVYGYSSRHLDLGIWSDSEKAAIIGFSVEVHAALPGKKPKYPFMAYVADGGVRQEVFFADWPSVFLFLRQAAPIINTSLLTALANEHLPTWDELVRRYAKQQDEPENQPR